MFRYWIKNRLLPDLAICVVLALLFAFALVLPLSNEYESIKLKSNIYVNTEIDFQIPNPSTEQLREIKSKPFISDVFGYYLTKTTVSGKAAGTVNLLLSDTMDNIGFTMFGEKNKLAGIDITGNCAYIDQTSADKLGVNAGDTIRIAIAGNTLEYIVCGIYSENTLFDEGTVVVGFEGNIRNIYESNVSSKSYAAAFIHASDLHECKNYLRSYIPMGRLRDRSEFESTESWELYNNTIKSGNYQNEITDFSDNRVIAGNSIDSAHRKLVIMTYAGSVAVGVIYFVFNIILRSRKSEKKYFRDILKNKSAVKSYRWLSFVFDVLIFFGCSLMLSIVFNYICIVVWPFAVAFAFFVICLIMNMNSDKKYIKSKRYAR